MEIINSPDTIYFHVTKACNLHCAYCYFSAGESMDKELSTEEALSVLESAYLLNPRRIVFTGGEPLLRRDILKLVQAVKNIGDGIQLCITTNGTLINQKNAEDLVENFDEIRISIDGFEEINDAMRGKGTFKKVMKGFRYILNAGGDPIAFITATSLNLPYLKEFMHFLLKNGILKIHISPLKLVGRARDDKMSCDFEDTRRIVDEFWYETFGLRLKSERKETFNCGVGKFLTVDPDGAVYPCHVLAFPEFCIGNVRKQRLDLIYHNSSLMNKLRNLHFSEIVQCAECFKELSREGTCLGVRAQERNFRKQLLDLLSGEANVDAPEFSFGGL